MMQRVSRQVFRQLNFKLQLSFSANPLQKYFEKNIALKNSIRFEQQNKNWTFEELQKHSNAFAKGVIELGLKKGDKILLWVEKSHNAEIIASQLGASLSGTIIVPCVASNQTELEQAIQSSNCSALIFSPNSPAGSQKYVDLVNQLLPELQSMQNGEQFQSKKFSNLKFLVSTGFYHQRGTLKFRDILNYDALSRIALPEVQPNDILFQIGAKTVTIQQCLQIAEQFKGEKALQEQVIDNDARIPQTFARGALNSLVNGSFVVLNNAKSQVPSLKELEQI